MSNFLIYKSNKMKKKEEISYVIFTPDKGYKTGIPTHTHSRSIYEAYHFDYFDGKDVMEDGDEIHKIGIVLVGISA